ncbi:hypothetical protein [Nocardioides sp. W7]|uniref:hypothetical protein n=1 Tax=Nocardioides sp. W7 TaxID=2931390 RepID=UPI001FD05708|nr:hypothetical protein [Nocardioides sp. W7]
MIDHDTLELRRMVETDPGSANKPDLPALIRSGRRIQARRRVLGGGLALGAAAVVTVPLLALTGGPADGPAEGPVTGTDHAQDVAPSSAPTSAPAQGTTAEPECGVLSCVEPDGKVVETGRLIDELPVHTLPSGAEEILYVAQTEDVGDPAGRTIEVLSAGYRDDGKIVRTVWALHPVAGNTEAPRFWSNPGHANGRPGDSDHYVVLGYVKGSPAEITWSTPDGDSGPVAGLLRLDGYTAFYLTRPMPADYVAPPRVTRNPDGSYTVETDEGPRTVRSGESFDRGLLIGDEFAPDLTVHTSDGWSCTLQECGTSG